MAPPVGESNKLDHLEMVNDRLWLLLNEEHVDLLCLGEVDDASISWLQSRNTTDSAAFVARPTDEHGTRFNMGFVYRRDRLMIGQSNFHVTIIEGASKKMAQSLIVSAPNGPPIVLFVVHWPSRIYLPPESHTRAIIGQSLRDQMNITRALSGIEHIIVLGDFNDEPYNDSVSRYLYSTRDIEMARKYPDLLYNPFWRLLPNEGKYTRGVEPRRATGSYYFSSDKQQRWKVFDQILVSSQFVSPGPWSLNEEESIIWPIPHAFDVGPSLGKMIDHLPVFAVLEKEV